MQAVQIDRYSKNIKTIIRDIPIPSIGPSEVLVKVKAAAVNPLELLIITGSIKLIQDYQMPITLGNECSGIIESVGKDVKDFHEGDMVYARLPISKIGAFAEYAAVDQATIALMPANYDFITAAAIPLTGLTAWQGLTEELEAERGKVLLITGGSGSFGQMAVPLAKALGLHVIVTGNSRARESIMKAGAEKYIDYTKENYWEILSGIDYVIDTLGADEFQKELSVLKTGGKLLSLRTSPNRTFAAKNHLNLTKRLLFTAAGAKYDRMAGKQNKEYRFMFVHSDGTQLKEITKIIERNHIIPKTDPRIFTLESAQEALELVKSGKTDGKVIIKPGKLSDE